MTLILDLFPGIGLLSSGFESAGFCTVRGPDLIWGGDIRTFRPPPGKFTGIIGGPPCQDFSSLRRTDPTGHGEEMLDHFVRCITEAQPDWWLMENVPRVPNVIIPGYSWQRLDLRASEFGLPQRRIRHIQFGHRDNLVLLLPRQDTPATEPAALATDTETPWDKFCMLQGLPPDFDIPSFTVSAKRAAVGNGVPVPMAYALAHAILNLHPPDTPSCACGCGRPVTGSQTYAGPGSACRMRALRRRQSPDG